ncbi:hypothetical protein F4804DRAFT_351280 [Jackrogersella minutella]|nr:hypothetical protein F4804DRAFT_351280 [Jackrogersella minutella]
MSLAGPPNSGFARRDAYHVAEDKGRALLEQFKSLDDTRTRISLPQLEKIYELSENQFEAERSKQPLGTLDTIALANLYLQDIRPYYRHMQNMTLETTASCRWTFGKVLEVNPEEFAELVIGGDKAYKATIAGLGLEEELEIPELDDDTVASTILPECLAAFKDVYDEQKAKEHPELADVEHAIKTVEG